MHTLSEIGVQATATRVPGSQAAHSIANARPRLFWNVPEASSTRAHAVWPSFSAKNPGSHSVHTVDVLAPSTSLRLPGGHALHLSGALTPVALEKVPVLQGTQVVSLDADVALLHVPSLHETHFVRAEFENTPGPHGTQRAAPDPDTDPGTHSTHVEELELAYRPAAHAMQLAAPGLDATLPVEHGTHLEGSVAPSMGRYFPGAHGVQNDSVFAAS